MFIYVYIYRYIRSHFGSSHFGSRHFDSSLCSLKPDRQVALLLHGVPRCLCVATAITLCLLGASSMVHTRSAAGRSKRKYRALDLGFAPSLQRSTSGPPVVYGGTYESPPPVFYGVELSYPSVTPPPVFYGVESSDQFGNDYPL